MKQISQVLVFVIAIVMTVSCQSSAHKSSDKKETNCCSSDKGSDKACCSSAQNKETSCCSSGKNKDASVTDNKVAVYYFHGTRRCATCQAVEKVTKETIAKHFAGDVDFSSVNIEENTEMANEFHVSGQTLLVKSKNAVVNLTTEAFLNARKSPEKLSEKLVTEITPLLQ